MVRTGDLLTGRVDSPVAVYMDTLYDLWGSDTVHGDKIAYSKIAIGLLDSLNRTLPDSDLRHNIQSRKGPWTPLLTCCPDVRTASLDDSASARAATAPAAAPEEVPAAPTGSRTATTPTSPTGTIPSAASSLTGTSQPSPNTRARAANLAFLGGVAAVAASITKRRRTRCGRDFVLDVLKEDEDSISKFYQS